MTQIISRSYRFHAVAAWLIAAIILFFHIYFLKPTDIFMVGIDDSFISYRYAENLASGHGFRFNPGGERVEGFTSFLWVLVLAAMKFFGFELYVAAPILGIIFALTTLGVLLFWLAKNNSTVVTLYMSATLLVISPIYAYWAPSGMDAPLFTALVFISLCYALGQRLDNFRAVILGLLLVLTGMARPEGVLVAAAIYGVLCFDELRQKSPVSFKSTPVFRSIVVFSLIGAFYFAWRFSYFGYLLPNTFYAKVGASYSQVWMGLKYLYSFFLDYGQSLLFIPLLTLFFPYRAHSHGVLLVLTLFLIYLLLEGGDTLLHPHFRYISPLWPLFVFLIASIIDKGVNYMEMHPVDQRFSLSTKVIVCACFAVSAIWIFRPSTVDWTQRLMGEDPRYAHHRFIIDAATYLRENAESDATVATALAGAIPYISKLDAIDILGLNDTVMAHMAAPDLGKGEKGHERSFPVEVLARKPTYIILNQFYSYEPLEKTDYSNSVHAIRDLYAQEQFHAEYLHRSVEINGKFFNFYQRISSVE